MCYFSNIKIMLKELIATYHGARLRGVALCKGKYTSCCDINKLIDVKPIPRTCDLGFQGIEAVQLKQGRNLICVSTDIPDIAMITT